MIARLTVLALDPATKGSVPNNVRVFGQNVSVEEIRDAVARMKGIPKGTIQVGDVAQVKKKLKENQPPTRMSIIDYAQ